MSLSLAILIGWQLYIVEPELQAERAAYEAQQQAQKSQTSHNRSTPASEMLGAEQTKQMQLFRTMGSGYK